MKEACICVVGGLKREGGQRGTGKRVEERVCSSRIFLLSLAGGACASIFLMMVSLGLCLSQGSLKISPVLKTRCLPHPVSHLGQVPRVSWALL